MPMKINDSTVLSLPPGAKYLHESSLELSQSKLKPISGYVSAGTVKSPKTKKRSASRKPSKTPRTISPDVAAPQSNLTLMSAFLKKKPQVKQQKRSKSRDEPKRPRKKSALDLSKERENYNRKLDETVQRILDREKEYLEEQLLREKRENKVKDEMVNALKSDIARLKADGGQ